MYIDTVFKFCCHPWTKSKVVSWWFDIWGMEWHKNINSVMTNSPIHPYVTSRGKSWNVSDVWWEQYECDIDTDWLADIPAGHPASGPTGQCQVHLHPQPEQQAAVATVITVPLWPHHTNTWTFSGLTTIAGDTTLPVTFYTYSVTIFAKSKITFKQWKKTIFSKSEFLTKLINCLSVNDSYCQC